MARIPAGEEFGQLAARPQRAPEVVPGANGEAIGQAVAGFGQDLQRIDQQQLRERKQLQEAADRANADTIMQRAMSSLDEASDAMGVGIKGGQIAKDQAAQQWQQQSTDLISGVMGNVPEALRGQVQARLDSRASHLGRGVGRAVMERDQSDVRAGLDQTLETAGRMYLRNPQEANNMVATAFEQQGPFSGLDAQQLGRMQQNWREATRFNKAATMVQDARNNNGSLDQVTKALGGEEFADLTPERRLQLSTQIEGFKTSNIQRAEAARARAEAQQRAQLDRAQAAYSAAQGLVMTGKALSHDYVTQLSQTVAGTPFAKAVPELVRQAPEMSAFGTQPLAVQQQILQQTRAKLNQTGTSPDIEKQVNRMDAVYQQSLKDYREDPLLAAQERGVLPSIAPLDTSSMATMLQGLAQRSEQARIVSGVVGQAVSPLLRTEAEQAAKLIQALPVEQKSSALAQLASTVGPAMASALGRQMAPKDQALGISLGMAGSTTTQGRYTSELVLRGSQALKDKAIKEDNAAITGVRARIASEYGNAVSGPARETLIDAALMIYYGKQAEGGGAISIPGAVALASGGVAERNGRKFVLPYGVPANEFEKKLQQMNSGAVAGQLPDGQVYVGQTPMSADDFVKNLPKAALITSGNGRYTVQAGGGLVTNSRGQPVFVEVK